MSDDATGIFVIFALIVLFTIILLLLYLCIKIHESGRYMKKLKHKNRHQVKGDVSKMAATTEMKTTTTTIVNGENVEQTKLNLKMDPTVSSDSQQSSSVVLSSVSDVHKHQKSNTSTDISVGGSGVGSSEIQGISSSLSSSLPESFEELRKQNPLSSYKPQYVRADDVKFVSIKIPSNSESLGFVSNQSLQNNKME